VRCAFLEVHHLSPHFLEYINSLLSPHDCHITVGVTAQSRRCGVTQDTGPPCFQYMNSRCVLCAELLRKAGPLRVRCVLFLKTTRGSLVLGNSCSPQVPSLFAPEELEKGLRVSMLSKAGGEHRTRLKLPLLHYSVQQVRVLAVRASA
jgi:hypothetical protein